MPRLAVRNYPASVNLLTAGTYINIPYVANMQIGAGSFYNAMWFNAESNRAATVQGTIYQSNGTDNWLNGILYYANNKALGLYVSGNLAGGIGSSITGLFSQFGNGWHRLVVVFNSSDWKARVYVDGALFYTTGAYTPWNVTAVTDTRFGYANLTNNALFQHSDIVLGTGVPTLADVQADYYNNKLLPSATHRYLLTEGSGTNVADSIGGNTGTVTNTAVWQTASPMKSRSVVATGQNLLKYSEAPDNAAWTTTSATLTPNDIANPIDGAVTAYKMTEASATAQHRFYAGIAYVSVRIGQTCTASVYVKAGTRNWFYFTQNDGIFAYFNLTTGVNGTVTSGSLTSTALANGWYRLSWTFQATTAAPNISFGLTSADNTSSGVGNGTGTMYFWGMQLVRANWSGPYVQTTSAAVDTGNIRNIVAQNQNLVIYSSDISNAAWTKVVSTVSGTDGIVGAASSNSHSIQQTKTYTAGASYILSASMKAGAQPYCVLGDNNGGHTAWFNLTNGTLGSTASATSKIMADPSNPGYYICELIFTAVAASDAVRVYAAPSNAAVTYTGDGSTVDVYAKSIQLVQANWAGPYQVTTSAAVNTGNIRNLAPQTQNLFSYSDPSTLIELGPNGNVTAAAYAWANSQNSNAITFGDNSLLRYAYKQLNLSVGVSYTLSVFMIMDDLSVPIGSSALAPADFDLIFNNSQTAGNVVTSMGNNIYRISYTTTGLGSTANYGVVKYVTNSAKGFKVSGYQINQGNICVYKRTFATPYDIGNLRGSA